MDPSRVAGAVAKGRAWEGPALAQALALGDPPEDYHRYRWRERKRERRTEKEYAE